MSLPITIPFTFGSATTSIPLSNLDSDFSTIYAAVNGIGNGSVSLANVSVTGGLVANVAISGSISSPAVFSTTSAATLTPSVNTYSQYNLTAQAASLSIAAPTGTPSDGMKMTFRFLDDGTSQAISWNSTYYGVGITLPTATTAGKTTYIGLIYNANNTRWDVIAITTG
jgi:hypothetical protein